MNHTDIAGLRDSVRLWALREGGWGGLGEALNSEGETAAQQKVQSAHAMTCSPLLKYSEGGLRFRGRGKKQVLALGIDYIIKVLSVNCNFDQGVCHLKDFSDLPQL